MNAYPPDMVFANWAEKPRVKRAPILTPEIFSSEFSSQRHGGLWEFWG
jgi:hypothetical protein